MDRISGRSGGGKSSIIRLGLAAFVVLSSIVHTGRALSANDTRPIWTGLSSSCSTGDAGNVSISCYGVRIVRKIVQQILERSSKEPNIEILDGISLVEIPAGGTSRRARFLKGFGTMGPVLQFLEGRELRIKLPTILPQNIETAVKDSLPAVQGRDGGGYGGGGGGYGGGGGKGGGGGGGGGKKGGGGGGMILALMTGKIMAAMGFGAVGLMAMKALMVSAMALMLSMIVAVKKLAGGGDDHGGHHVVYAQEVGGHHHRRRRTLGDEDLQLLPYRGYANLYGESQAS